MRPPWSHRGLARERKGPRRHKGIRPYRDTTPVLYPLKSYPRASLAAPRDTLPVNVRSLGYRTDLFFFRSDAVVVDQGDCLVVRSPDNPT